MSAELASFHRDLEQAFPEPKDMNKDQQIQQLERELCEAKYILRLMVMGLPSRRDWLNPDVEKAARQVCGPIPEALSK